MADGMPEALRNAAIAAMVSGVINFFVMPAVIYGATSVFAGVCALFTFGLGGIFALCGLGGCLLVPLGVAELAVGAVTLVDGRQGGPFLRWLSWVQMASVLVGGFGSLVAGLAIQRLLADDAVRDYLG